MDPELLEYEPLVEQTSSVIVPRRGGVVAEDGTVGIVVIRPCISRGKRLAGLPPIYSPQMLEANAGVFRGWHMFIDHLVEELAEGLPVDVQERLPRARGIRDGLGGRILETRWHPTFTSPEDAERGFHPGAVIARARPIRKIREMLEDDPELLRCSINAYPTRAVPGEMWGQRGMMIEGIRAQPRGSVDWVLRDGAGGRVLMEGGERALSLVESLYAPDEEAQMTDFSQMTVEQLQEHLRQHGGQSLVEQLASRPAAQPTPPAPAATGITADQLQEAVDRAVAAAEERHEARLAEALDQHETAAESRAQALLEEREQAHRLERAAHAQINAAAGLTPGWREDLRQRYTVLPSGAAPALLVEGDGDTSAEDVLKARVQADIDHATARIREANPAAVRGQGPTGSLSEEQVAAAKKDNRFRQFLQESGDSPEQVDEIFASVGA